MEIQKLIDEFLQEEEKSKRHEKSGKLSPSAFGYCFRRQIWNRRKEPPSEAIDLLTLRKFRCGRIFEDWISKLLESANGKLEYQVKVEVEDILGYADAVNTDTVYDFKTMHSKAFWYMTKEGYDITQEKRHNILQVMSYAVLLKKEYGCLVFISKDDLAIEERKFKTADWADAVDTELGVLRQFWVTGDLPPAQPRCFKQKNGGFKECSYCPYLTKCNEEEAKNG